MQGRWAASRPPRRFACAACLAEAGEGSAELDNAGLLKRAALRIESLEQQLMWREEKMAHAVSAQKELRERVLQYHNDFAREKEEIFDVASDMTRQYKGMQEELLSRINLLENQVACRPQAKCAYLPLGRCGVPCALTDQRAERPA